MRFKVQTFCHFRLSSRHPVRSLRRRSKKNKNRERKMQWWRKNGKLHSKTRLTSLFNKQKPKIHKRTFQLFMSFSFTIKTI